MAKVSLVVLLLSSVFNGAYAFQLNDHSRITNQAYLEFNNCFLGLATSVRAGLVDGDIMEDLNLINKEIFFAHYYHPRKNLHMRRATSAERIENLEPYLMQCRSDGRDWSYGQLVQLGHAIHHIQDMTVPAHVVPVEHGFFDGFESYTLNGDISSQWTCADLVTMVTDDLPLILRSTAEQTLDAVQNFQFELVNKDTRKTLRASGTGFWQEAAGDEFGNYGSFGNNFGVTEFVSGPFTLQVADEAYREFKRQQMKLAVRQTLRAMVWAFRIP